MRVLKLLWLCLLLVSCVGLGPGYTEDEYNLALSELDALKDQLALYEPAEGDFAYVINDKYGGAEIIGYAGNTINPVIPSMIDGNQVVAIGAGALANTGIKSVVIPDTVVHIGEDAFMNCIGLKSVDIPDGITEIADYMFYGCTGLNSFAIPGNVAKIGEGSFEDCTNLVEIILPTSVKEIGHYAFRGCSGISEITLPDELTQLGTGVFLDCPKLVVNFGGIAYNADTESEMLADAVNGGLE